MQYKTLLLHTCSCIYWSYTDTLTLNRLWTLLQKLLCVHCHTVYMCNSMLLFAIVIFRSIRVWKHDNIWLSMHAISLTIVFPSSAIIIGFVLSYAQMVSVIYNHIHFLSNLGAGCTTKLNIVLFSGRHKEPESIDQCENNIIAFVLAFNHRSIIQCSFSYSFRYVK